MCFDKAQFISLGVFLVVNTSIYSNSFHVEKYGKNMKDLKPARSYILTEQLTQITAELLSENFYIGIG